MRRSWKQFTVTFILVLAIATVTDALSCGDLANHMFTSRTRAVYWAKRYFKAGCGFDIFGTPTGLPTAEPLPWETAESEILVGDKVEQTHLERSIDAFIQKDYRKAIEHAKQHTDQYVVSRIVGVSSCALKDKDAI